jgi:hypothetical protein
MSFTKKLLQSWFGKAVLASAALGGFLLMGGTPQASAADFGRTEHRRVEHRVGYDQMRYHRAVARFGRRSPEARHWARVRRMDIARREHVRREFGR